MSSKICILRKKERISAIQFDGTNEKDCKIFANDLFELSDDDECVGPGLWIIDRHAAYFQEILVGEWIIKNSEKNELPQYEIIPNISEYDLESFA